MRFVVGVLLAALATGCAADTAGPARVAERFHAALAAHRMEAACGLLAGRTAEKLPGRSCAEALSGLRLRPGGVVTEVSVWGDEARVRLEGDTLFLHHFGDGWRVVAAGCVPLPGLPYACEVKN